MNGINRNEQQLNKSVANLFMLGEFYRTPNDRSEFSDWG